MAKKKLNLSYKKSKLVPGKAPEEVIQEKWIEKITEAVHESDKRNDVVLFLDPMHQIHNSENGYSWQFRGKDGTKKIPANTGRRRLNIIGALNPVDLDAVVILTESNCDKEMMAEFLVQIRKSYPDARKINIFLDNATYNRALDVQKKAEELGIVLEFLPAYSPNLNLIERLWKFFKKTIMKDTYYPTFEEFYQATSNFFKDIKEYHEDLKSLITLNFEII